MIRAFVRNLVDGPAAPQLRRFVLVGCIGASVQLVCLWLFVDGADLNYLVGALFAIEIGIVLQYVLNNAWTFRATRNSGVREYLGGLARTNVIRATAMPIQLSLLYALVEWGAIPYLPANAVAIGLSGIYRYVLDARWTWG